MSPKTVLVSAALLGATAVVAGAFAAHGLKATLSASLLNAFTTGAHYQLQHSAVLLGIGVLLLIKPEWRGLNSSARMFVLGVLLFSGSLYALALTGVTKLGIITPFGGVFLIGGWVLLGVSVWRGAASVRHSSQHKSEIK